jgi:hypothetical protein
MSINKLIVLSTDYICYFGVIGIDARFVIKCHIIIIIKYSFNNRIEVIVISIRLTYIIKLRITIN